jgi:hypothetical protein
LIPDRTNDDYVLYLSSNTQKKHETRNGLCTNIGDKIIDDQRFTTKATGSTKIIIPKTNHKRTTITDIHAAKIDEETALKDGLYPRCLI